MRPWCRILIEVTVPGISSPVAALRGVPTSSNGPWSVIEERRAHRGSGPSGFTKERRPGDDIDEEVDEWEWRKRIP
jgi:hypothetical protein